MKHVFAMFRRWWATVPAFGHLTLAALVVCAISGVAIALVYRPDAALDSLALVQLKNPAALFARSVHYWSAQAFLVLAFLHVLDHLRRHGEIAVPRGIWIRVALSCAVIVYAMLSGFLLRGDPDSVQAAAVFRSLLQQVPWFGRELASLLVGNGESLVVVFVHHVCTATLIIWLITVEHARRILPGPRTTWFVLVPVLVVALLAVPGLVARPSTVEKGPWYLIGLQELLHLLPSPEIAVWLVVAAGIIFAALPVFSEHLRRLARRGLTVALGLYAALSIVGIWFRGPGWELAFPPESWTGGAPFESIGAFRPPSPQLVDEVVPMIRGQREGCMSCHAEMSGFAPAHDPSALGCAACHLGDPFTLDAARAHAGMTRTPGDLSVVDRTCATAGCHQDIAPRVRSSLMNTMSGVVAVDKFVFGEAAHPDGTFDVRDLGHSPVDTHLRNLCASCHLGADKPGPGPIDELSRGGGCSACHLDYSEPARAELARLAQVDRDTSVTPQHHPRVSLTIPSDACFGCHSRSGRLATNFEGWHETFLQPAALNTPELRDSHRVLADGRVFERQPADVHFERGMTCLDCHIASEIMGDGHPPAHESEAVKIACADCHVAGEPAAVEFAELEPETQKIVALRKLAAPGRRFVRATRSDTLAYPAVQVGEDGRVVQLRRSDGEALHPKPPTAACGRDIAVHRRMECRTCHSAWAPQCITCHTAFDREIEGWDHLAQRPTNGSWVETADRFFAEPPVLGVIETPVADGDVETRVGTFVPGMIMTLDKSLGTTAREPEFHRLHAPTSPHTTVSAARDCQSCHASPLALGYGRGRLEFTAADGVGRWTFVPTFPRSERDGLPLDAWTGFLQEPTARAATRTNVRPFSLEEQRRILLVGACLACHASTEPRLQAIFGNFAGFRAHISPKCALPDWIGTGNR